MHVSITDGRKLLVVRFVLQLQNMPCSHMVICCRLGVDKAKGYRDIFKDLPPAGPEKGFIDHDPMPQLIS